MGATLNFVRHVRECLIRTLSSRAVYINWRRWGLVGGFRGPVIGTLSLKANEGGWGVSGCMTVGVSLSIPCARISVGITFKLLFFTPQPIAVMRFG
eukprot:scaffold9066_cov21-Tisochrysis_lutea.AAC.1